MIMSEANKTTLRPKLCQVQRLRAKSTDNMEEMSDNCESVKSKLTDVSLMEHTCMDLDLDLDMTDDTHAMCD